MDAVVTHTLEARSHGEATVHLGRHHPPTAGSGCPARPGQHHQRGLQGHRRHRPHLLPLAEAAGGLKIDQAKRLKELELENARVKRVVAELTLDKLILKEVAEGQY